MAVDRTHVAHATGSECEHVVHIEVGDAKHREVADRIEGDHVGVVLVAVGVFDDRLVPTRHHVRVGDDEPARGDPAAAFLDLAAGATADLHDGLADLLVDLGRDLGFGWQPRVRWIVERRQRGGVRRVGDRSTPCREVRGLRGREGVEGGDERRAARHARGPALRGGEGWRRHPDEGQHTERADRGTCESVPGRQWVPVARVAVRDDTERESDGLSECGDENEEQHRDRDAVVGARSAERGDDARDVAHTDDQTDRHSAPREDPRDEAEAPASDGSRGQGHDDREIECVHDRSVARRAVGRG